jgi:hypothetical protein
VAAAVQQQQELVLVPQAQQQVPDLELQPNPQS